MALSFAFVNAGYKLLPHQDYPVFPGVYEEKASGHIRFNQGEV
jgi:hypothetical protein